MARKTPEQLDAEIAKAIERANAVNPTGPLDIIQRDADWWMANPAGKKFGKSMFDSLAGGRTRELAEQSARERLADERRRLDRKVRDLQKSKESALKTIANKAGKAATVAREVSAGDSGTCQICARTQKIVRGAISLHGYQRPGIGYIVGDCFGAKHLPFEVSCDRLREWIEKLKKWIENTREALERLPTVTELFVDEYVRAENGALTYERGKIKTRMAKITPSNPRWLRALEGHERRLQGTLKQLESDLRMQGARLAGWKPARAA